MLPWRLRVVGHHLSVSKRPAPSPNPLSSRLPVRREASPRAASCRAFGRLKRYNTHFLLRPPSPSPNRSSPSRLPRLYFRFYPFSFFFAYILSRRLPPRLCVYRCHSDGPGLLGPPKTTMYVYIQLLATARAFVRVRRETLVSGMGLSTSSFASSHQLACLLFLLAPRPLPFLRYIFTWSEHTPPPPLSDRIFIGYFWQQVLWKGNGVGESERREGGWL